jgi:hypothetical protein
MSANDFPQNGIIAPADEKSTDNMGKLVISSLSLFPCSVGVGKPQ